MLRALSYLGADLQGPKVLAQTQVRFFQSSKKRVRKPRWLPRAPSKLFELPKHPEVTPEERDQYWQLYTRYNIEIKSIQAYFHAEQARLEAEKGKFSEVTIHEEENFEKQLKAVEDENKAIAERRKVQHEEAFQARIAALLEKAKGADELKQREIEEARRIFNREMDNFQHITLETLDEAIAKALDKPSDYNFAVSATGEILHEKPRSSGH